MERFIKTLDEKQPKKFALFITWGGAAITDKVVLRRLTEILVARGQVVVEGSFECFGGWKYGLLRRGRPNSGDFEAAKLWAKRVFEKQASLDVSN